MEKFLAIDTCLQKAFVILFTEDEIIDSDESDSINNHAAFLHVAIHQMLTRQNLKMQDLSAIGVTTGPGSYTGIRVGISAAKGLSFPTDKPIIPVNTLQLMAASVAGSEAEDVLICPMIDARRMEVFTAVYDVNLREIIPPTNLVLTEESIQHILGKQQVIFTGDGAEKLRNLLPDNNSAIWKELPPLQQAMKDLCLSFYNQNFVVNALNLKATYVKDFYNP